MAEEKSEVKKVEKEVTKSLKSILHNYWAIAAVVLAILLILALIFPINSGISKSTAAKKVMDFAAARGANATLVSVTDNGSVYEVILSLQGQNAPVYITKDGKNLVAGLYPLEETAAVDDTTTQTDVPKADKPVANFFVFSYCPYGTQMEKALIPVYNLLKSKADINIVFIGAMHGEYEKVESLRQLCIQKNYGKDKLFSYLDKFLANTAIESCQGTATCVNPLIEAIYPQIGIDKNTINTCMTKDAEAIYTAHEQQAQALGISGSPSTTINGVNTQVGRSPALIQQAICSAFTTAPAECSQTLSTTAASPGFGTDAGSNSAASCN